MIFRIGLLGFLCCVTGCQTMGPNEQRGTALGALTGGMVGAAVGSSQGKSPEGALIGAVAGAATGNAIGNATDQEIQQARYDERVRAEQARQAALTFDQIVEMQVRGLGPDVIVRQIQAQGLRQLPTVNDLIFLQNNGLPDTVLIACQSAVPFRSTPPAGSVRIVPECEVVYPVVRPCPVVPWGPPPRHFHYQRPGSIGFHFGF
ncbi:MAG: glycine zipper domain-containing protein [Mariniblastus sp.]|nr:glycine zipper domain-containing protein [Mariniblastus sp.]